MEIPEWIKTKGFDRDAYERTSKTIEIHRINTICVEANCPNRYECFSKGTATFMILGRVCTRNCLYCNVAPGVPEPVDDDEPKRIADAVKILGIKHAVVTCVTRDDLDDGGASQFSETIRQLRPLGCTVEVLISDLNGNWDALETIVKAKPDVLNHNIEVVESLYPEMRPQGNYRRALELLAKAKEMNAEMATKSGFMVGLGETFDEISKTLADLEDAGVSIVTIGQYLRPTKGHAAVRRFYTPEEFQSIKSTALGFGIKITESFPLVRSSYNARESFEAFLATSGDD